MTTAPHKPADILVVDDDDLMRMVLELHLADEGYTVRTAEDAVEAGKMLIERTPDLLLLDIRMPHMTGDHFLELLRGDEKFKNLKVIVLTAERSVALMLKITEFGISDFINKPVEKDLLIETVKKVLAK